MPELLDNVAFFSSSSGLDDFVFESETGVHNTPVGLPDDTECAYGCRFFDGSPGYETGVGRWNAASSTLSRDTVKTSPTGVKFSFGAGQKIVEIVADSSMLGDRLRPSQNLQDVDDAAVARSNLGLDIGSDVQAHSAVLDATTASYTEGEKSKLATVESGATGDQTGAEIKAKYEGEANTNAFTDAEKSKLAGLESSRFLGTYVSLGALQTAHASPAEGSYAHVDAGVGQNVQIYIWDNDDSQYQEQSSGSSAESAASVKAKYESNPDTNAFTDAERTKLIGVESGATADQTGPEIKARYEGEADTNAYTDAEKSKLASVESGATADQTGPEVKALYESQANTNAFTDAEKSKLSGIEASATADQTGAEIKQAYESQDDTNALTDDRLRTLRAGVRAFGLDRDDGGPVLLMIVGQSIAYGGFPYRNGPYPPNARMHDYRYISPGVYGFVQAPDLSDPLRDDHVEGITVGMVGDENGDIAYGWAEEIIDKEDRDVYILKFAIGGASVKSLEATHWDNGVFVDSTPGALYTLLQTHMSNAKTLLSAVTDAPAYPDYLLFTQGATNSARVEAISNTENADYLPPLEWAERALRVISMWSNPGALDYISEHTRIVLLGLPNDRSWDYTGDHMRVLADMLGGRAILIGQGEGPLYDHVHPMGDRSIEIGREIDQTARGQRAPAPKNYGLKYKRNKTNLEYTEYLREADGVGDVTEDLRWRYDSTNDLLIVSPTDGATINWGWFDLRAEDHYRFSETADSNRSVVFRVVGRGSYDPTDIYQLRIPVVVSETGSSGWPRVGEALTSLLVNRDGDANHLTQVYALDSSAPRVIEEEVVFDRLALDASETLVANLATIGDTALVTVDPYGKPKRSRVSSQNFSAEFTGLSSVLNPTLGGVGAEPGVVKAVGGKVEIWGRRIDSGVTDEVWEATRKFIAYFDGTTVGFVPPASAIHQSAQTTSIDTGTAPQTIEIEGVFGALTVRPSGIAGQTWRYRSTFTWEAS